ncbi:reverse transcriptase [Phytophthora megakarya]|uniref:Reverse transcriptase n=1 Tax=Phytophthora megakarya TaxID=4795 RepID=A0A225WSM8_9STRA|nr:reverse transcriptase [Phytophthora megakarya]
MSDFFRTFNKILGQRQRATMTYRPQPNGTAERMVQTATSALKMYVRHLDQKDWESMLSDLPSRSTRPTIRSEGIPPLHCQSDAQDGAIETRGGGVIGSNGTIRNRGSKSTPD